MFNIMKKKYVGLVQTRIQTIAWRISGTKEGRLRKNCEGEGVLQDFFIANLTKSHQMPR